jgi:hypothetical protein
MGVCCWVGWGEWLMSAHSRMTARLTHGSQVDIDDFPNLKKWEDRMWARDALKKGANVPEPYGMKELLANKEEMEKHAAKVSDARLVLIPFVLTMSVVKSLGPAGNERGCGEKQGEEPAVSE